MRRLMVFERIMIVKKLKMTREERKLFITASAKIVFAV